MPPGLAFCFMALGHLLGCGARSSPTTDARTGRTAHVLSTQGGAGDMLVLFVRVKTLFSHIILDKK